MGTALESEIREQPEALGRALDGGRELARTLGADGVQTVMIVARGSSDNAARYAQYLFGARLGIPVALAAPSLHSIYGARAVPRRPGDLVLGISQSGRSPDVIGVLEAARAAGTATAAIVNDESSPLAAAADHVLALGAGVERSVAATKTYMASLAALASFAAELGGSTEDLRAVDALPAIVEAAVAAAFERVDALALAPARHVVTVARGYNYATAMEIALKVRELTANVAEGFSAADLLHGPIAAVSAETLAVVIAADGKAGASALAAGRDLERRGTRLLTIASTPDATLPLAAAVPEWLSPLPAVVPGQVQALRWTEAADRDVDSPGGLSKVTETL